MGKRSNFERVARDYYPTPIEAVEPLIDHLPYSFDYVEPCAGDGRLINHIHELTQGQGECLYACDIEPQHPDVMQMDALQIDLGHYQVVDFCITNPPWDRKFLHPFIEHWLNICPMWLLFDADWMHTKQSSYYMTYCRSIVSVGRVKWFGNQSGKDNCCWYLFDAGGGLGTQFHGRMI
jgi:hypothetical protein